jgi:hypothetical protein
MNDRARNEDDDLKVYKKCTLHRRVSRRSIRQNK